MHSHHSLYNLLPEPSLPPLERFECLLKYILRHIRPLLVYYNDLSIGNLPKEKIRNAEVTCLGILRFAKESCVKHVMRYIFTLTPLRVFISHLLSLLLTKSLVRYLQCG